MIKDIVVHLTGSDEDTVRLAYAGAVAGLFDAHLTGLQVNVIPEIISMTDPSGSAYLQTLIAESTARADAAAVKLREQLGRLGTPTELRRLDVYPGEIGKSLATEVRTSDLFVGTRPYGDPAGSSSIEETVLFRSGRPCVFLPPKQVSQAEHDTVFVAWKNTPEAARALANALPFLAKSSAVIIGIVEEGGAGEQYGEEPGADVGRYLSRHGIGSEIRMINGWNDTGAALLNESKRAGADLIVMGGYGHSRFREWALGGATRHLLDHAEVPVLMAH
ncbi:MAG: universal stress protein [Devosia sp.]|nr:universal stress protein [Devosia sp.]